MPNIGTIIKSHNAKLISNEKSAIPKCNCQRARDCPLHGKCRTENIVYSARVVLQNQNVTSNQPTQTIPPHQPTTLPPPPPTTPSPTSPQPRRSTQHKARDTADNRNRPTQTNDNRRSVLDDETGQNGNRIDRLDGSAGAINGTPNPTNHTLIKDQMTYIGAAENFKQRYANHLKSFRHEKYKTETELSKYIWSLKANNLNYSIHWKILRKTSGYNKISKSCNLCLSEKLEICKFKDKRSLLNKRTELISKCRHENKHLIANYVGT